MKVSVLCPTFGRPEHLPRLYQLFAAQTHPEKELLVFDDSPRPSPFFATLSDPRVRYHHTPERVPLGRKRNWLAEQARGEILAHFDDDDYYAPRYLARMLDLLGDADAVKLSAFYLYSKVHKLFAYWDLQAVAPVHYRLDSGRALDVFVPSTFAPAEVEAWRQKNLLGFGFSCVYRRESWQRTPFPEVKHGEDYALVQAFTQSGRRVRHVPDREGLALVVRHAHDHSVMFPQHLLPLHLLAQALNPEVERFLDEASATTPQTRTP